MKVKYLGTGAAEGVPAMFCRCPVCENIRRLGESEYRTRSQVLIDGCLSVDFPPEAYFHSLKNGFSCGDIKYLLVTHSHMDHFYAHDFILRGYRYAYDFGGPLQIYGNAEVKAVFEECTLREMKPSVAPNICFNEVKPYQKFTVGGYTVMTLPANHGTKEDALLYYVSDGEKGYLHMYDTGLPDCDFGFLKERGARVNLVSLDCTYADGGFDTPRRRHMNVQDGMEVKKRLIDAGVCVDECKFVITHFSHNCNPVKSHMTKVERKYGVIAAYDGMDTEV
ncbi:MAG: MBL fold metallo-hydrolase [Clostridia bacterium]|nr:MBL fold metallo-hydrolase [Clostridia bacterium]